MYSLTQLRTFLLARFVYRDRRRRSDILIKPAENIRRRYHQAATILEFHQELTRQDFLSKDSALPLGRHDAHSGQGKFALELFVNILLETQATLEPTATARDFRGIERR